MTGRLELSALMTPSEREANKRAMAKWLEAIRTEVPDEDHKYGSYEEQINDYWKSQRGC